MLLKVGAALPDPPFELMTDDGPAGFDITLMQRVAAKLSREWQLVPYRGADFNGIFAGLNDGSYDCIASGTTIRPIFARPMRLPAHPQVFDLVIGIDSHARRAMLGDQLFSDRLAGVALLHPDHEAVEVVQATQDQALKRNTDFNLKSFRFGA